MKVPYTFGKVRWDKALELPDGDYTVGRGADPRGKSADPSGRRGSRRAGPSTRQKKLKKGIGPQAAE